MPSRTAWGSFRLNFKISYVIVLLKNLFTRLTLLIGHSLYYYIRDKQICTGRKMTALILQTVFIREVF